MNLLDFIASTILFKPEVMITLILAPFVMLLVAMITRSAKIRDVAGKIFAGGLILVFGVIVFMSFLNTMIFGAGYVREFDELEIHDHTLVAVDYLNSGDGEGNDWQSYRLHGVELPSGKKLFRTLIGTDYYEIAGYRENTIWTDMGTDVFAGYDLTNGKKIREINKNILAAKVPELKPGVEGIAFLKDKNVLQVVAKDGLEYTLDPLELKVVNPNISANDEIETSSPIGLSGDVRKKIVGKNGRILNSNLELIEGEILATYPDLKIVTAIGFESTDKKAFTLYGLSFEGKVLWQISQPELKLEDFYSSQNYYNTFVKFQNNLIVGVSGILVSIDAKNGEVQWKERL